MIKISWFLALIIAIISVSINILICTDLVPNSHESTFIQKGTIFLDVDNFVPLNREDSKKADSKLLIDKIDKFYTIFNDKNLESNGILATYLYCCFWNNSFRDKTISPYYWYRLPVLFISGLSLVGIYWLGCKFFNKRVGIIATFLLSINAIFLITSSIVRFYAYNTFFCILSALLLLLAIERNSSKWWMLYGLSGICCISTMMLSALILPGQIGYFLILSRYKRRAWKISCALTSIWLIVFVLLVLRDLDGYSRFHYHDLNTFKDVVLYTLAPFTLGTSANWISSAHIDISKYTVFPIYTLASISIFYTIYKALVKRELALYLPLLCSLLPMFVFVVAYYTVRNMYIAWNFSWCCPFSVLLLAYMLSRLKRVCLWIAIAFISIGSPYIGEISANFLCVDIIPSISSQLLNSGHIAVISSPSFVNLVVYRGYGEPTFCGCEVNIMGDNLDNIKDNTLNLIHTNNRSFARILKSLSDRDENRGRYVWFTMSNNMDVEGNIYRMSMRLQNIGYKILAVYNTKSNYIYLLKISDNSDT